jgi:hypothetical protein
VAKHLNAFNTVVSQLLFVDIKIFEENRYISILCFFPDSWDSLVVAIGRNKTTSNLDDVVASMLLEEMR